MAEKQKIEIDAGLLEELRRRARGQSCTEGELLEEIARRYLVLAPRRRDGTTEAGGAVSGEEFRRLRESCGVGWDPETLPYLEEYPIRPH